jgi:hypothetical protein
VLAGGHEQAPMAGELKGQKNKHPKRKGQAPTDGCKPCHIPGWYPFGGLLRL